jgi:RNA polymerase sigma-70 factor (ECF subfamily)
MSSAAAVPAPEAWQPPSWDDIVSEHSARIYRWAYRLTGNAHDAEDLTQDVFVRVFRSLSTYRPGSFEGWLHRITTNLFLDGVRRTSRARTWPLDEVSAAQRLAASDPDPGQAAHDARLDADLQAALDALSPEFRAVVLLADLDGRSYDEISRLLGIKSGTVRSRLHRGRRQLRAALAHREHRPLASVEAPGAPRRSHHERNAERDHDD